MRRKITSKSVIFFFFDFAMSDRAVHAGQYLFAPVRPWRSK